MSPSELRQFREQLGLSQARLARLLGVDVMTVSRWERGERTPENPRILELALEHLAHLDEWPS